MPSKLSNLALCQRSVISGLEEVNRLVRTRVCIVEAFCGSVSSDSVGGLAIWPRCRHCLGLVVAKGVGPYVPGSRSSNVWLSDSIEVFWLRSRISLSAMMF